MIDEVLYDNYYGGDTMTITPTEDLKRWAVQKTITILANSDYYYTKDEVDDIISEVTMSGVTKEEVDEMIAQAIATKADRAEVEALAEKVAQNTADILNRYTKEETNTILEAYLNKLKANEMFAKYTQVQGNTLVLNAENYGITI